MPGARSKVRFRTRPKFYHSRVSKLVAKECEGKALACTPAPTIHCRGQIRIQIPLRYKMNSNAWCILEGWVSADHSILYPKSKCSSSIKIEKKMNFLSFSDEIDVRV